MLWTNLYTYGHVACPSQCKCGVLRVLSLRRFVCPTLNRFSEFLWHELLVHFHWRQIIVSVKPASLNQDFDNTISLSLLQYFLPRYAMHPRPVYGPPLDIHFGGDSSSSKSTVESRRCPLAAWLYRLAFGIARRRIARIIVSFSLQTHY